MCLVLTILVIPLVVLNKIGSFTNRIVVIVTADAAFVLGVAVFSRARTVEVFIAGATQVTTCYCCSMSELD